MARALPQPGVLEGRRVHSFEEYVNCGQSGPVYMCPQLGERFGYQADGLLVIALDKDLGSHICDCSASLLTLVIIEKKEETRRRVLNISGQKPSSSSAMSKKVVAVFGATEKEAGAEVVAADLDDEKSVEAALSGAYAAFVVTNFLEHFSKDKEIVQGKRIADVSKRLGLTLVVFSGLENVKKLTGGKLEVMNFDGKGEVEEYFREIGVPMTSVRLPCYYENLLTFFRPQKDKDGDGYTLCFPMGDVPLDGMSVKDLGVIVLTILQSPSKYAGKDIGLSMDKLTTEQYAAIMTRVLGKNIRDAKLSPDAFAKLGFPGAEELANMFKFYLMKPDRDIQVTLQLNPKAKKFQCWLEENKAAFDDL
ncbi:PREDICTED: nmrA-like family domain-containing protein 1 [Nanorana parkeri]|uniref:nmrA-like family domain-containing protein 1 n=1 Tax=Nanorana parkeri TaxID=125878 RepID=UPI000854D002|nr:PREDICTED: nmrA-like family domain-containing protein 1 [Nanorana parkeri]